MRGIFVARGYPSRLDEFESFAFLLPRLEPEEVAESGGVSMAT